MENDRQWKALVAFTREEIQWAGKREPLAASTRILHDLRVDGDDAVEFIEKFFDTFEVSNVESFPFHRYFGPEGAAAVPLLIIPALVAALTLGMLLEAICADHWDTDAIERRQASARQ